MSKYYKAEDVINLLATEYYTYKQAEIIEVEDCKAAATFNTRHLSAIDIVTCGMCENNTSNTDGVGEDWCLKFGYEIESDDWCSYGERIEE